MSTIFVRISFLPTWSDGVQSTVGISGVFCRRAVPVGSHLANGPNNQTVHLICFPDETALAAAATPAVMVAARC